MFKKMCGCEVNSLSSTGHAGKLGFLDTWRFLNIYGSLFFKKGSEHLYETRACKSDLSEGSVRCIRFTEDDKDYALVTVDCWDHVNDCNGVDISGFREILNNLIMTAYIE
jgi:hypothetical protein